MINTPVLVVVMVFAPIAVVVAIGIIDEIRSRYTPTIVITGLSVVVVLSAMLIMVSTSCG